MSTKNGHKYTWHLGDCLDLLKSLPDNSVQLIFTSPPYNIGKEYEEKLVMAEYLNAQDKIIEQCIRVLREDGSICWQVGSYVSKGEYIPLDIILYRIFMRYGLKLRNRIIWAYEHGMHARHKFSGRYETISWFTLSDEYYFALDPVRVPQKQRDKKFYKGPRKGEISSNPLGKNPGDVWNITNVKNCHPEKIPNGHPCQFPLELASRVILSMSRTGDLVLDPFGGTATTLIASLQHGRIGVGAEIDPKYHLLGQKRIAKLAPATATATQVKFEPEYVVEF